AGHPAGSSSVVLTGGRSKPMTRRWRELAWDLALLMLCAAAGLANAQDADPPGRAARLSDAEGAVSLQPAGVEDWTAAAVNRPLTTRDRLGGGPRSPGAP